MKYSEIPPSGKGMDIREHGPLFMMIEHAVLDDYPDLTPHQFIVYAALMAYTKHEDRCFPSIASLARRAHIGTTATKEALNKLVEFGLVRKIARMDDAGDPTSNLYLVIRPSTLQGVGRQTTHPSRETTEGRSADDGGWVAKRPLRRSTEVEPVKETENPLPPWNESARFLEFWSLYPNKAARPIAEKAFHKHINADNFADLIAGLLVWKDSAEWTIPNKDGRILIPHPSTFLNQHRWNDRPMQIMAVPTPKSPNGIAGQTRPYTREELREQIMAQERRAE